MYKRQVWLGAKILNQSVEDYEFKTYAGKAEHWFKDLALPIACDDVLCMALGSSADDSVRLVEINDVDVEKGIIWLDWLSVKKTNQATLNSALSDMHKAG